MNFLIILLIYMIIPSAWGQTQEQVIKAGDRVQVQVICKETTGEIILTTNPDIARDKHRKKSVIYNEPKTFEPLKIIAGKSEIYAGTDPIKPFNSVLPAKLSSAIIGMRVGESASLTFHAPVSKELSDEERYIKLAKNQRVDKAVTIPKERFIRKDKSEPVVGQESTDAIGLIHKITAVTDSSVVITVVGKDGGHVVETPWGTGILHDEGKEWRLEIQPKVGRLVRTGPYVGRISEIQEKMYVVDFGHPFGNESIECDISIVSIMESSSKM